MAAVLVREGIDEQRIRYAVVGANEPIATQAYTDSDRAQNDRVEILQINTSAGNSGD